MHLNNSFDDDRVRVEIDGKKIFDERVATDYVWGLVEVVELRTEGIVIEINEDRPMYD